MISVVAWRWGSLFGPEYVDRLRAALERNLRIPHRLICVTDDPVGIDSRVKIVDLPQEFRNTPRCRRRVQMFSRDFSSSLGRRILTIDLDVVIVGDITGIVDRPEPFVGWKVGYAGVYSGSFHLMDAGALDPLWRKFKGNPEGIWRLVQAHGTPSDQALLNWHLRGQVVPHWTETDGFVTYFGKGYERLQHRGVGPGNPYLPPNARIVVLGSADKEVMDGAKFRWVRDHWTSLPAEAR